MPEVSSSDPVGVGASCNLCMGCGQPIRDQFIYKVLPDMQWHENCLKCAECDCRLRENSTCFVKNGRAYCKNDYNRLFMVKCDRCTMPIKRNDLVMKAKSKIYHFDCFACSVCGKRLQPGDEYQIRDDLLYCREDSMFMFGQHHGHIHQHATYGSGAMGASQGQLYLSGLNSNSGNVNYGSSVSLTPENSISSSASSTSSTSFSPNTNSSSSSSSSSLMDSPSTNYATLNATANSSYHGLVNNSFTPNSTHSLNNFFPAANVHINSGPMDNNNNHQRNDTYDSNEKDGDDNSVSNMEDEREEEEDDDEEDEGEDELDDERDMDNSISEESSLNESATSVKVNKSMGHQLPAQQGQGLMNRHLSNMGRSGSGKSLLQLKSSGHHHHYHHHHAKPARIRTVLNEKQLHTLRSIYSSNPRPDALMKEHLVELTGLNPRVIRVWFQNKRCKDKKKNMLAPQQQQQTQQPSLPPPPQPAVNNVVPYQFQHFPPPQPPNMFDSCY